MNAMSDKRYDSKFHKHASQISTCAKPVIVGAKEAALISNTNEQHQQVLGNQNKQVTAASTTAPEL